MHFGFLICLCLESNRMLIGLWCVQLNAQGWSKFGVKNLKNFTQSTKKKEEEERPLKQGNFGRQLYRAKSKLELLICYTRMHVTENPISKIWVQLSRPICALRLLSTLIRMRWLSVIWLRFLFQGLSIKKRTLLTLISWFRLPGLSPTILTLLLIEITIQLKSARDRTSDIDLLELVFKDWRMFSLWWKWIMILTKLFYWIIRFSKQFTTEPVWNH